MLKRYIYLSIYIHMYIYRKRTYVVECQGSEIAASWIKLLHIQHKRIQRWRWLTSNRDCVKYEKKSLENSVNTSVFCCKILNLHHEECLVDLKGGAVKPPYQQDCIIFTWKKGLYNTLSIKPTYLILWLNIPKRL